ncbi:hypothetical protein, partial [Dokdonella sp.]|uniref:hypothetical protein n=1 Tax=Dokdonella sp. TaxID=2291710 RepID=UPI00260B598E
YVATIGAQPTVPNQTCSLANASGTVAGQNTTSIEVHCVTNTYSVGGTVTGLSGSGLTLHLDNGDDVAVSGNGFVFPNRLPDGTSYVATIGAQPTGPNQTCSLANASGSVAGQDVTSIEVHCVTNTYFVGGIVTGLAGSGLVLHLDNGDTVPVSGSSFLFPTPLTDGSAYVASVTAQPTAPKQTCTIANPSGSVAGNNVNLGVGCTTNRYTVGGHVVGLDGQVKLRINGGDELTATGDGPFTFHPIDDETPWVVTLSGPPSGGASTLCRLHDASGTLAGANVDDVLVTCDYLFVDGFDDPQ